MKALILLLAVLISAQTLAANYGKFKIILGSEFSDPYEAIILMNSSGDVKIIDNDDYMTIDASQFFGQTTLDITSMGDEDFIKGTVVLSNNKVIESCSAFIDQPNEVLSTYGLDGITIQRWSKSQKKFVTVKYTDAAEESQESCNENLIENYAHYDQF